ncbi:unnamed protein product [Schistosoma curassoni]|uniref:Glutamine amidotransferase type-2 domain-containing protein n=1 Tax=Schistosoma curassoni TaxID=6186 RepID=A0A183KV15_9TREM|nr:unnamed protein product [Schistosoma curassoni]
MFTIGFKSGFFLTPLGGSSIFIKPVKAPGIRFSSSQFRIQHSRQIRSSSDITLAKHFDSENISIGQVLLDAFSKEKNVNAVVNLINSLIGSFVLIFVSVESHRVYFTRDPFGRHSLVARKFSGLPSELFCIDSVSSIVIPSQSSFPEISLDSLEKDAKDWFEIPACGIFVSKIVCDNRNVFLSDINLYPWSEQHLLLCPSNIPFKVNRVLNVNQTHCNSLSTNMCIPTTLKEVQQKFLDLLSAVIHDSVNFDLLYYTNYSFNVSDVLDDNRSGSLFGLLFSGGLDSSVIAALLDRSVSYTSLFHVVCFFSLNGNSFSNLKNC